MASRKILVVDDVPEWRDQFEAALRRDGYEVTAVTSYGEALSELRWNEYQLVITELCLSAADENNLDGMMLLEDLAALGIPAIVLTGHGTAELARKAFRDYGVVAFLEKKDLKPERLRQAVGETFSRADELEKELAELRARFLRGEIIRLPENRLKHVLREKPEEYGDQ